MIRLCLMFSLCLLFTGISPAQGQAGEGTAFVFASIEEGQRILLKDDQFIQGMSPFDRAARVKTDRDVSKKEFLAFIAASVLQWDANEKKAVEAAINQIQPALKRLLLPPLGTIYIIKTTGAEEGNVAYTRGSAIVFPKSLLAGNARELQRLLAHELFHVLSGSNAKMRELFYQVIGFRYCGEIDFPTTLRLRKITNPDAPQNDHCIRVRAGDDTVWVVPILFSQMAKYDPRRGGEFFDYVSFAFLLVGQGSDLGRAQSMYDKQRPTLFKVNQIAGFFEQVGRNTEYIIHPEEILADNFALLVLGEQNVLSPEVLAKMKDLLTQR